MINQINNKKMGDENILKMYVEVPFPSSRLAEIAYHVLRVDTEPKRSRVMKKVSFENDLLKVKFSSQQARQLRVAVSSFFDNVKLIMETMQFIGEPASPVYSHFV